MTTNEAILILTRSIEDEYGSAAKVPDNDERKQVINKWYRENSNVDKEREQQRHDIRHCWLAGMTCAEIISATGIDKHTVYYECKRLGKSNVDIYYLRKGDKVRKFRCGELANFLSVSRGTQSKYLIKIAERNGYVVRVVRSHDY